MTVVPFSGNENGQRMLITLDVFLVLDYVFVCIRYQSRHIKKRALEFNDWAMLAALVSSSCGRAQPSTQPRTDPNRCLSPLCTRLRSLLCSAVWAFTSPTSCHDSVCTPSLRQESSFLLPTSSGDSCSHGPCAKYFLALLTLPTEI